MVYYVMIVTFKVCGGGLHKGVFIWKGFKKGFRGVFIDVYYDVD